MVNIYFAGIDLGSTMTKVVIIDRDEKICASVIKHTGAEYRRLANKVMEEALEQAGLSFNEISYVVATGYGRITVPFADRQITELTCHAKGLFSSFPNVRLAIDIGGQDCKVARCDTYGNIEKFEINDKCAAGTGRYLERIANTVGITLEEFGSLSLNTVYGAESVNSSCAVFAQMDVARLMRLGKNINDILA